MEGLNFNPGSATSGPPLPLRASAFSSVNGEGKGPSTRAERPHHRRRLPSPVTLNPHEASCLHLTDEETEAWREKRLGVQGVGESSYPTALNISPGTKILPHQR